ncbi:MAG: biotin carboxylase N-terminal domain-containing protein [Nitriliruptoraceae bacterium]
MSGFHTLLVANRGEIAVRVIRTARALGYRTVAIHSDADSDAPHVRLADDAVHVGPSPATESYLRIDRVLDAARVAGAEAIHPGYGFLSENAAFARAVIDAGLVWVGPPPAAIEAMGDKAAAKRLLQDAGVPLLPGYQGTDQSDQTLLAQAAEIGVPLMVKAAAGGGGKGMRLVTDAELLPEAIGAARREAASAFGSDDLILERALLRPRHVEIQVLADEHGNVLSLGERDCSIQRRHQKVVEEAPSPAVDAALRTRMGEAAVAAARTVGYVGAGTVEFLLDPDTPDPDDPSQPGFFFLEMNTRLQVEHPVTELITGLDLVEWQLRVAQGETLGFTQDDVTIDGHAIEVRLYAEDPANDFLPASGTVAAFEIPDGVRVDTGVEVGSVVGAHYDPMIAKVIAHGPDRDTARRRLRAALADATVLGLTTNRSFLVDVLSHERFASGEATTAFLGEVDLGATGEIDATTMAAAAAVLHRERTLVAEQRAPGLAGWDSRGHRDVSMRLAIGEDVRDAVVHTRDGHTEVRVDDTVVTVEAHANGVIVDDRRIPYRAVIRGLDDVALQLGTRDLEVRDVLLAPPDDAVVRGEGILLAPMHGAVTAVHVATGDRVALGDAVAVLEAMKMEHAVTADIDGTVVEVAVTAGSQVAADTVLVRLASDEELEHE